MPAPKKKLGRGLAALLGDDAAAIIAGNEKNARNVSTLPMDALMAGVMQPRRQFDDDALKELTLSVKAHGVLQPLLVRAKEHDRFEIIAGERRFRAAMKANLKEVPVLIVSMDDDTALQVGLVENLQRKDLNPLEEALGYARLGQEFKRTQEDIAKIIGKSRPHITNMLRLLTLPDAVQEFLKSGALTIGHVRLLIGRDDALRCAKHMLQEKMSVREAEEFIRGLNNQGKQKGAKAHSSSSADPDILNLQNDLTDALGLKVRIRHGAGGRGGTLTVHYGDADQLQNVIDKMRS